MRNINATSQATGGRQAIRGGAPAAPASQTAAAAAPVQHPPASVPLPVVQADYLVTQDIIKTLTDIRFRLLGFVPSFSTVGVTLVTAQVFGPISPVSTIAIGLMGFFLTLGLLIYDLRNSGIYDGSIHRAKMLEKILNSARFPTDQAVWPPVLQVSQNTPPDLIPIHAPNSGRAGGAYRQRLPSYYSLLVVPVKHDAALALIYGVSLAAWVFPIAKGVAIVGGMFIIYRCDPLYGHFWCVRRMSEMTGIATSCAALIISLVSACIFYKAIFAADNPRAANALTDTKQFDDNEDRFNKAVKNAAREEMTKKIKQHWFFRLPICWLLRGRKPES